MPAYFKIFNLTRKSRERRLIPISNPVSCGNFFTRGPGVERTRRDGIRCANPAVYPYDSGITFPNSSTKFTLPFLQSLFGRLSGFVHRDYLLFAP
jgi:hypothetical protein